MARQADSVRTRIRHPCRARLVHSLFAAIASLIVATPLHATAQDAREASMADVRMHFASCIEQPHDADGTQVTAYFSLKSDGEIYGKPRIVLPGYPGSQDDRRLIIADFLNSFDRCLPLPLDEDFARTIPGKVYFLQFRFGTRGSLRTEVRFRPYGSAGFPLEAIHRHRRP
jgi:hypothetical protein